MRNKVIPASHMVFMRNGNEVLLQRRLNTGFQDGMYSLPSGHIERDETAMQAAIRESLEEVGVIVRAEGISLVHTMYRIAPQEEADRINFFFLIKEWQGEIVNKEPHKCDDLLWVKRDSLPENTIDYIRSALNDIGQGKPYSERDQI